MARPGSNPAHELTAEFQRRFHQRPRVFRAPGRVNLIGEHTDYNEGFVMPAAIDRSCWIAIAQRPDRKIVVHSVQVSGDAEINLDELNPRRRGDWSDYVQGVAVMLERSRQKLRGANMMIASEVPMGSGLSSSAALEVSTALALLGNSGLDMARAELARLCQRAENDFVGARCGIMDQFVACFARAGHALLLDCRSLEYRLLPIPPEVALVICDTGVRHELAAGEYNTRRAECESGVRSLAPHLPHIRALRDVSVADLEQYGRDLPDNVFRRCRHVISENVRVTEAAAALEKSDCEKFGRLMYESHRSLRDDYEVSCAELDILVEAARKVEGVYGARMTGGGFGGSTVSLVRTDCVVKFHREVAAGYEKATGRTAKIYVSAAAQGASEVG